MSREMARTSVDGMRLGVAALLVAVSGCAQTSGSIKRSAVGLPNAKNIARWPDDYPLAPGQELGIVEVGRTATSSIHVVQIRHQEPVHIHRHHDLVMVLLRGEGTMRIGPQSFAMEKGSIAAVPHGVPHGFTNTAPSPAALFVVFSPPFDAADKVPVTESAAR